MKKLFFAIVLAAIASSILQAQNAGIGFANYENNAEVEANKPQVTGVNGSAATINDVNNKAVMDFVNSCKKVENIHWYIETKGTFVYYFMNGNKGRRFYDKKGNFVYNILSYNEEFLPHDIREQVKSVYYFDYHITQAEEIQLEGKTIYIVHLENQTTWLNVKICDGEMEVIKEFSK